MTLNIDPEIFSIGPLSIRWYGLMYVLGFINGTFILKYLIKKDFFIIAEDKIDNFVTHCLISMIIGSRIFYVFVYNWDYFSQNLLEAFYVWQGGLSFHGAIIGLILGGFLFAKKNNISRFQALDVMCLCGPQGLFLGRIGNFINGELYGRVTKSPLGVIFPEGGILPRHPSQLYESFGEGIVLFLVLYFVFKKTKTYGTVTLVFLAGYGFIRFLIEFVREPDYQLGYYFNWMTMGQILCLLMILISLMGIFVFQRPSIVSRNN